MPEMVGGLNQESSKGKLRKVTLLQSFWGLIVEVLAPLVWVYVIIKLFVFDVDRVILSKFAAQFIWLIDYRFFIILGFISIAWIVLGSSQLFKGLVFIVFYPIVLVWRVLILVYKQKSWNLAFTIVNSIIVFFRSFKYSFIAFSFFLISTCFIFTFSNSLVLWTSLFVITAILILTYLRSFIFIIKPPGIFQVYKTALSWVRTKGYGLLSLDPEMKSLTIEQFTEKQLEKWNSNLQLSVLANRVFLVAAKKLRDYQRSSANVLSYVITILLLILFTIFSFGLINFAIFKIDSTSFILTKSPHIFLFFYYSFSNLFYRSINEITPNIVVSQSFLMLETICSVFLLVILATLFFSIRNQRYLDELDGIISDIEEQGRAVELFIKDEYGLSSINDAIEAIAKLKNSAIGLVNWLTKNIE
ncbi:MAG: hypothetical protein M1312_02270 [Patescibacteria group bacterium]|nr:hypothetical protein [Patescibacteria group bacterium]